MLTSFFRNEILFMTKFTISYIDDERIPTYSLFLKEKPHTKIPYLRISQPLFEVRSPHHKIMSQGSHR